MHQAFNNNILDLVHLQKSKTHKSITLGLQILHQNYNLNIHSAFNTFETKPTKIKLNWLSNCASKLQHQHAFDFKPFGKSKPTKTKLVGFKIRIIIQTSSWCYQLEWANRFPQFNVGSAMEYEWIPLRILKKNTQVFQYTRKHIDNCAKNQL